MIMTAFIVLMLFAFTDSMRTSDHYNLYGMRRSRTLICSPLSYKILEPEISNSISNHLMIPFTNTAQLLSRSHTRSLDGGMLDDKAATRTKSLPSKSNRHITWQKHYNELKHFREEHGHCSVPQNYLPNKKLGLWVMQQRRQYTLKENRQKSSLNGTAGTERIELLNDIDFVWKVRRRGSLGAYGVVGLRRLKRRADATDAKGDRSSEEFVDTVDFEKLMIEKHEMYSDEEMRAAWRQRFKIFL